MNGINVAWGQWTADLIDYDAAQFEGLFSTLEASGGNAIRWWWFIDGEQQLTFQGNLVQPLAQRVFDNLDAAFAAAAKHGILIMPVLLSFDIENTGREFPGHQRRSGRTRSSRTSSHPWSSAMTLTPRSACGRS